MMPWFRLYPEILKDPKIRRFTTVQKWLWIAAMCEASQSSERGKLFIAEGIEYTDEDLAQAAGLPSKEWEQAKGFIDLCVTLKMMERHADGGVTLVNFLGRQYEKPSDTPEKTRERKRKQRAKEAEMKKETAPQNPEISTVSSANSDSHDNVTPESREDTPIHAIYTDTDSDTDTETELIPPPIPSSKSDVVVVGGRPLQTFKSVRDLYKHYFAFDPSPFIQDLLHSYLDDGMQHDALAWAMRQAAEKGKAWDYAKGTIERLFVKGVRTAEQAELAEHEFQQQKEQKQFRKVVPIREDKLPASVQRQLEREKAAVGNPAESRQKRTVMDDPELAALYKQLREAGN
ncbi:DnaD domain protein [Brevibacillus massiliensis]|uniref:DnaD domain protein n=1 Tax=Brevibacillus massiliensis TaxID=1118054 RepID=UPI0003094DFE|nr:DnaD domain protein [Brevibacillus massiliensis]